MWVMNTKQGFQDCEAYVRLEEWLGSRADEYWDNNFDTLELVFFSFLKMFQPLRHFHNYQLYRCLIIEFLKLTNYLVYSGLKT